MKKIKNEYVDLINIYMPLLSFLKNLKYFSKYFKITKNKCIFYFNRAISQKMFNFFRKKNCL